MVKESEVVRIREILEQYPKGLTIEDVSQEAAAEPGDRGQISQSSCRVGAGRDAQSGPAKLFSLSHRVPLSQMPEFLFRPHHDPR